MFSKIIATIATKSYCTDFIATLEYEIKKRKMILDSKSLESC